MTCPPLLSRLGLRLFLCLLGLGLLLGAPAHATVDGGKTATLLGVAQKGRYALVLESSVQETCQYEPCVLYVLDTEAPKFERLLMKTLPGRFKELLKIHCPEKKTEECSLKASRALVAEEGPGETQSVKLVVKRYLETLTVWQQALLADLSPPPAPLPLKVTPDFTPQSSPFVLDEIIAPSKSAAPKGAPLEIHLKQRWTAPSFRSTTERSTAEKVEWCHADKRKTCQKVERWEDGQRQFAWVCEDACAGRASFVRVEAGYRGGELQPGRSSWVEPGALAQAAIGLTHESAIDLSSLQMSRHSLSVYRLPRGVFLTGGFAHGMFANGTWFPLVVFVKN